MWPRTHNHGRGEYGELIGDCLVSQAARVFKSDIWTSPLQISITWISPKSDFYYFSTNINKILIIIGEYLRIFKHLTKSRQLNWLTEKILSFWFNVSFLSRKHQPMRNNSKNFQKIWTNSILLKLYCLVESSDFIKTYPINFNFLWL